MNRGKVVGYVRSLREKNHDCDIQKNLISRYSETIGLGMPVMFIDKGAVKKRTVAEYERAKKLGIGNPETTKCFPAWEEMLSAAICDKVSVIIVDRKERLYSNLNDKMILERIIHDHNIRLLEAEYIDWPGEIKMKKVAAYHYFVPNTRRKGIRTANLIKDLGLFYEKVYSHRDWKICGLYIDDSACRRIEFPKLKDRSDLDLIICKYFYHINRKTLAFLKIVDELSDKGTTLISIEEGTIHYLTDRKDFLDQNIRSATYDFCRSDYEKENRGIQKKRFDLFYKTIASTWIKLAEYEDRSNVPGEEFKRLKEDARKYDVVVIDSFTKLGEGVNELMNHMKQLDIPVYSLQEGLLYINEKEDIQSNTVQ